MLATTTGWDLDVERGPSCLFVRLRAGAGGAAPEASLAEQLWALMEQHFTYCLVLEMDEVELPDSRLLRQIAALAARIDVHDGMLRLCGLSPESRLALDRCNLSNALPAYPSREDALFGRCGPCRPR
ncbi:MAG: STAS domain-containing protein [Thermoguttaceae bacterium]